MNGASLRIVDRERGIVQGIRSTEQLAPVVYDGPTASTNSPVFNVSDEDIRVLSIDPVLASIRLDPSGNQAVRVGETRVSLELLSGLFFLEETTEVSVSVVLDNGRRFVVTDPSEIVLQSSDESILAVRDNFVIARGVGTATVTVTWMVCGTILGMNTIEVSVEFSENRPLFGINIQAAGVFENSSPGTPIATVFANDLDFANSGSSSRRDTEYRFKNLDESLVGLFALDKVTGLVSLTGPVDRETRDSYIVQIEATDRAQRQAEQSRSPPADVGSDGGSESPTQTAGSGSGSGQGGTLTPDATDAPSTTSPPALVPVDALTVSSLRSEMPLHLEWVHY